MRPESSNPPKLCELAGVGPSTAEKLKNAGVFSAVDLAAKTASELVDFAGIDSDRAHLIIGEALSLLQQAGFLQKSLVRARELYEERKRLLRCTTGSRNLDELLCGGIETQAITEFYGEFGTGKTQIAHTLCATCQVNAERGGLGGRALYLDTENTFRASRLYQIAEARGMDPAEVLSGVFVTKMYNASHLELMIRKLGPILRDNSIRVVVVDSVISLHRAEFAGRGTLAERQQKLNGILHTLLRAAEVYNCAVVVTNQVLVQPDAMFRDPTKPAGGHILAHASTYRVYLKKAGKERIARMVDSPYHPNGEARFVVDEKGASDLAEEERGFE